MMLQGVMINLVAFGRYHGNLQGQSFTIFILTVAACEAGVALALILTLYRSRKTLDASVWQELGEPGLEPIVDEERLEPEQPGVPTQYPRLTPAGVAPEAVEPEGSLRA
jgi:NADH-quinone oxidoreductase subunit K